MNKNGRIWILSENDGIIPLESGASGKVLKSSLPEGYVHEWGCGDCRHRGQAWCSEEDCDDRGENHFLAWLNSEEKGMKISSPKELLDAGIAPTLLNYLQFVGLGSCEQDCPVYELCLKTREKVDSMGAYPDTIGLCYKWSCPLYIYSVDKARSLASYTNSLAIEGDE